MSTKTALTPEAMKTLVKGYIQVFNDGNLAAYDEVMAPNFRAHFSNEEKAALRQGIERARLAFPDLHVTIDDQIVENDKVVTRWTARGTHQGTYLGVPATGKKMEQTGINITQIADGKIVAEWSRADDVGILRQLGILPGS
jgi:steroid delta-isomerase-like uncharacterized protein